MITNKNNTDEICYDNVRFTETELILLSALSKREVIQTWKIIQIHSNSISKTTFARAVQRLCSLGIMERISSTNYRQIHKRKVDVEDLGIVSIDYNFSEIEKSFIF